MKRIWNGIRVFLAVGCVAAAPLGMWLAWRAEFFARFWVYLVAPFVGLVLVALWYVAMGPGAWRVRLERFVWLGVLLLVGGGLFASLTRYEGSLSGTSLPRFVWRWAPEVDEGIASAEPVGAGTEGELEQMEGIIDSPQFLGPDRDGVWPEPVASFDWGKHPPEELWRQEIGAGWSGFAVLGRRAVTQEQRHDEELVTCYDLLSGDLLWVHRDRVRLETKMGGVGPRATPTVAGGKVYAFGGTGILNCLDLRTGELYWSKNLELRMEGHFPDWGKSTSPLLVDGKVVVSGAENAAPTLLAFDAGTGGEAWVYQGKGASYSSPRLLELGGMRQVVSMNGKDVTGHDPATGAELWRFDWPGRQARVGQPLLAGEDRLLVTASYGAGSFLLKIHHGEGSWSVEELWKSQRLKTKFSSAVIRKGYAYGLDEGIMACIDLKTGKRVWKGGRYGFGQQLLVGDLLLVQGERGEVALVGAEPTGYGEAARMAALDHMTWNVPTLAGRYLLVRNDREAVCYRLAGRQD